MRIIDKIEIKNFRSFGNRKQDKSEIEYILNVNVFSGANDSGKSNILRALNLFFNKKVDLLHFFDFNRDFFKKKERDKLDIKEELATIKISFINIANAGLNAKIPESIKLPEKFWVSRKWTKSSEFSSFDQDDGVRTAFKNEKGKFYSEFFDNSLNDLKSNVRASLSKQLTDFLDSIQFHYVPAIKDTNYFAHLYGELQKTLLKELKSNVDESKNSFETTIQNETDILMEEFRSVLDDQNVDFSPVFELPDLINLFQTLVVNTGSVNLRSRGDGIQAKLIPEILNFISVKERSFTRKTIKVGEKAKKYFIWGFEEPENSYEYRNAQLLANRFKDVFCNSAQIFLTTHSFNFLSIEGNNISRYRIWKDSRIEGSRISKLITDISTGDTQFHLNNFGKDSSRLNEELGIFTLNKELQQIYDETERLKRELCKAIDLYQKFKKILFVEDKYDQIYKIVWLILNDINGDESNYATQFESNCDFHIQGLESAGSVAGFLRAKNIEIFHDKKIIGLFDFDKEGSENFYCLSKEPFWGKEVLGAKTAGYIKRRKRHKCFIGMLLPVPVELSEFADLSHENFANYIEVENLLPKNFLIDNNFAEVKKIVGKEYLKVKDSAKKTIWKNLFSLSKGDLKNFSVLFDNVQECLK